MEILFLLIGILIGTALVWFFLKSKSESTQAALAQRSSLLEEHNKQLNSDLKIRTEDLMNLTGQLRAKEADYRNLQTNLEQQKKDLTELREKFNVEFKNLANEILEEKTRKFTEQNKTSLDEIIKPLNARIKDFEKKVEETYDKESKERFSLAREVKQLAELNQQISKEANSLTKALKGDSKSQGDWGEVILESILDKTGLRKGQEYTVQDSFTSDSGNRLRSDIIVHYPGERSIVIDSKVSLTAYERYSGTEEETEKAKQLKEHISSIKSHINILASKNYQDIEEVKTLDFVILFMPIEPAYLLAIQHEPQLWSLAYDKRILLISPTNLVAVLKMIESLWKQEYQNRNVLEIARQGGGLYDDFVRLAENLVKLGKKIDDASGHYQDTMKKLSEGRGNLVSRVEKLKTLGVKAKKKLPDNILDRALEGNDAIE